MKNFLIFILAIFCTNMDGKLGNVLLHFKLAFMLTENTNLDEDRLG